MATKPITKKYTNVSTEEVFQFVFHCDCCGAPVKSEIYRFNADRFQPPRDSHAHTLLWTHQHDEAYERANNDARFDFNLCPICSRRVCNNCFHATSDAATDMCADCRQARGKQTHRNFLVNRNTGLKPSAAGLRQRGGATKRASLDVRGKARLSGVCDDEC